MKKSNFRLAIGIKIIVGYLPLLALIFSITSLTLVRLDRVNRINSQIVSIDMLAEKTAQSMGEILLAQESYGRRYIILGSKEILTLFEQRHNEFTSELESAMAVVTMYPAFDTAARYHDTYNKLFEEAFIILDTPDTISTTLDSLLRQTFDQQVSVLRAISLKAKRNQNIKMSEIAEIGRTTFHTVGILTGIGITLVILMTALISKNILGSISVLKSAASMVSIGTFIHLPKVKSNDELGDLSKAFNEMADRLITLEEASADASPLTRLPGGIAIENMVKRRIERGEPFAFCMFDLDNFKPFNDRYGYARGNTVIKMTAEIIQQATLESNDTIAFIGHIGGDDFVLITKPEFFEEQCQKVIEEFDKRITENYDKDDRVQQSISSVNRKGEKQNFPIMTISIAAINSLKSTVHNYIEVGEIIAELKKYAKKNPNSNLVVDRRGGKIKRT